MLSETKFQIGQEVRVERYNGWCYGKVFGVCFSHRFNVLKYEFDIVEENPEYLVVYLAPDIDGDLYQDSDWFPETAIR